MRILSRTFALHLCECRTSVVRIFMSHSCVVSLSPTGPESFKHVLKFYAYFLKLFQNILQECRATVVQVSRTCRRRILANLQCQIFATLVTMSCECLTMVARQSYENIRKTSQLSGEKIKLSDIRYECRAALARMLCNCHTN